MKLKVFFLFFVLNYSIILSAQNIRFPVYRISHDDLKAVLEKYDSLEIIVTINSNVASLIIKGYVNGISTNITNTSHFILQTNPPPPFSIDNNVVLRCYAYKDLPQPWDFPIDVSTKYFITPVRVFDRRTQQFLLSYRFNTTGSQSSAYYKSLNPIPPDTPGILQ